MTINGLHKLCGRLIAEGYGRRHASIYKDSFKHALEDDGVRILEIASGKMEWVHMADDDGGTKVNKDGTESGRTMLVLCGDSDDRRAAREGETK